MSFFFYAASFFKLFAASFRLFIIFQQGIKWSDSHATPLVIKMFGLPRPNNKNVYFSSFFLSFSYFFFLSPLFPLFSVCLFFLKSRGRGATPLNTPLQNIHSTVTLKMKSLRQEVKMELATSLLIW